MTIRSRLALRGFANREQKQQKATFTIGPRDRLFDSDVVLGTLNETMPAIMGSLRLTMQDARTMVWLPLRYLARLQWWIETMRVENPSVWLVKLTPMWIVNRWGRSNE